MNGVKRNIFIIFLLSALVAGCCLISACSVIVTLKFDSCGGSDVPAQVLSTGRYAVLPSEPAKEGYSFTYWYSDAALTKKFYFDKTKITKNTVLYAGWEINRYTIDFVTDGTAVSSITLPYDTPLELFESYLTGFKFSGWYTDTGCTKSFTLSKMPAQNLTLYAGWSADHDYSAFKFEANSTGYTLVSVKDIKLNVLFVPDTFNNRSVTRIAKQAFKTAKQIERLVIPDSVTFIDESAFENCTSLKSVTLPKLESISANLFYGCALLAEVNLPDTLTSIGRSAFFGCVSLGDIILPDNLSKIGERAFYNCNFSSIEIPKNVTLLSADVFYNCDLLSTVIFKDSNDSSLIEIGSGAFEDCALLKTIDIPQGVRTINSRAFAGSGLDSITLPDGVVTIGDYLFFNCKDLRSVVLPYTLESAGNYTFLNCTSLKDVSLPGGLTALGDGFFENCKSLVCINLPEGINTIGNTAFYNCIALDSILLPCGLTQISKSMFENCIRLKTVKFPDCLVKIDDSAFLGCSSLSGVSFPGGLTSIGRMAFLGCKAIDGFEFGENLREVGERAFYGTGWLNNRLSSGSGDVYAGRVFYCPASAASTVIFKEDTVAIASYAFYGLAVQQVELSAGIEVIGDNAFENCTRLTSLTLPESLIEIGDNAFKNNAALSQIIFNGGLKTIGEGAFWGCSALTDINILSADFIGAGAFRECIRLATATLPDGLTAISENLFYGCESLSYIKIPVSVEVVGRKAFYNNYALSKVGFEGWLVGEGFGEGDEYSEDLYGIIKGRVCLTVIDVSAFENCGSLTEIRLPDTVAYVMSYAFRNSGLIRVFIGSGIRYIGEQAFAVNYGVRDSLYGMYGTAAGNTTMTKAATTNPNVDCLTVVVYGAPIIAKTSFFTGTYLKIITPIDLYDSIVSDSYSDSLYENWSFYANNVFSLNTVSGDFAIQSGALLAYLGTDSDVIIPDSVTEIVALAFFGLDFIDTVTLNPGLKIIGDFAFFGTNITNIRIHGNINYIGAGAFWVKSYIYRVDVSVDNVLLHTAALLGENAFKIRAYHAVTYLDTDYYMFEGDTNIYTADGRIAAFGAVQQSDSVVDLFEKVSRQAYNRKAIYLNNNILYSKYSISWAEYLEYIVK